MVVVFEKMMTSAILPKKNNPNDAGWDVFATNTITLNSHGGRAVAWLGLKWKPIFETKEEEEDWIWELQIRPRSGMAINDGVTVLNTPGTVDQNYRNEIGVILINHSSHDFHFNPGDKIAQIIVNKIPKNVSVVEGKVSEYDSRGGGFGSSGQK